MVRLKNFKEGSDGWAFQLFMNQERFLLEKNNRNYKDTIKKTKVAIAKLDYFCFFYYSNRLNTLILRCLNNNKPSSFGVHFPMELKT